MWQHVKLSEQIHPWDTLACCWDVKQPTNKQTLLCTCVKLLVPVQPRHSCFVPPFFVSLRIIKAYASFLCNLVSQFVHGCLIWFLCRSLLYVICLGVLTYSVYSFRLLSKVICFVLGTNVHNSCVLHFYMCVCSVQESVPYVEKWGFFYFYNETYYTQMWTKLVWIKKKSTSKSSDTGKLQLCQTVIPPSSCAWAVWQGNVWCSSMPAFLAKACHQSYSLGSSLTWGLNFQSLVWRIFWSLSLQVFFWAILLCSPPLAFHSSSQ